jgi:hypothetical protein
MIDYKEIHRILNKRFKDKNIIWEAINQAWLNSIKTEKHFCDYSLKKYIIVSAKLLYLNELKHRKKYIPVSVCSNIIASIKCRYDMQDEYIESTTSGIPEKYKAPLVFIIKHLINKRNDSQSKFITPDTLRYTLRDVGKYKETRHYAKWIYDYLMELFKDNISTHKLRIN